MRAGARLSTQPKLCISRGGNKMTAIAMYASCGSVVHSKQKKPLFSRQKNKGRVRGLHKRRTSARSPKHGHLVCKRICVAIVTKLPHSACRLYAPVYAPVYAPLYAPVYAPVYAPLSLAHDRTSFASIFTPTCFKIDAGYRPLLNGYRPLLGVYRPRSKKSYSTLNMASVSACSVHHSRDRKRRSNCKSLAAPRLRFRRHVSFTRLVLLSLYRFLIHMYKHTCISPVAVEVPSLFSLFRFPWRSYRRQRRGAFRCRIVGEELKISTTRVLCFRQENPKFPPKKMSSLRFVVGS